MANIPHYMYMSIKNIYCTLNILCTLYMYYINVYNTCFNDIYTIYLVYVYCIYCYYTRFFTNVIVIPKYRVNCKSTAYSYNI